MMNSRDDDLSKHYSVLKELLRADEFQSPEGKDAILAMLKGDKFSPLSSANLINHCQPLLESLNNPNSDVARLTRMAMNFALISDSRERWHISPRECVEDRFKPAEYELKTNTPLDTKNFGFGNFDFGEYNLIEFNAICEALIVSNIESIALFFETMNPEKITIMLQALMKSDIKEIGIPYNDLQFFDKQAMQTFFHCISDKSIMFIYEGEGTVFINIGEENEFQLKNVLLNNYHRTNFYCEVKNVPETIMNIALKVGARNKEFCNAKDHIDRIRDWQKENKVWPTIIGMTGCVFQATQRFIEESESLLEEYPYRNEHHKKYANTLFEIKKCDLLNCRNNMLIQLVDWLQDIDTSKETSNNKYKIASTISQIVSTLQEIGMDNKAIDFLLIFPSNDDYYFKARSLAFQIAWNGHSDNGSLTAFINALPCYLSDEGTILKFDHALQINFDNYLTGASGVNHTGMLSDENRFALLKYVLLQALKSELPEFSTSPALFNTQTENLPGQIEKLPVIKSIEEIGKLKINLDNVWKKALMASEKILDENLRLLFQAVASMEKSNDFVLVTGCH